MPLIHTPLQVFTFGPITQLTASIQKILNNKCLSDVLKIFYFGREQLHLGGISQTSEVGSEYVVPTVHHFGKGLSRGHWDSGFHMVSLEQTRSCPAGIRKGHTTRREDCLLRQEVVDSRSHGGQRMSPWLKVLGKKKCFLRPLKLVTGACELN